MGSRTQAKLTNVMSKIDLKYQAQETITEGNINYTIKHYNFLDEQGPFFINCSEKFWMLTTYGSEKKCKIGFDYSLSNSSTIDVHNGFMEEFAIAEFKDSTLAQDLYKAIGIGAGPVFFNTTEALTFTHPNTGANFNVFRLRIDCKRDVSYSNFSCTVGAVK